MKKALELFLTAKVLTAQEGLDYGIIDFIVPVKNYFSKAQDWIDHRLQHHFTTIQLFKQITYKADIDTVENSLSFEKQLFINTWGANLNQNRLAQKIHHLHQNSHI